jgi:segregation and condensation protein B
VSSDERPESLAAQAASWVPPWERPQRTPDREYQAAQSAAAAGDEPGETPEPDDDEERSSANLADDDDDFDESFEGANPSGYAARVPPELAPLPGETTEPGAVDAPAERPDEDEPAPTDVGSAPEVPPSWPIEDAAEQALDSERGPSVDAPVDGDDAGGVFDAAADDDVSDDDEVDLPVSEMVPDADDDAEADGYADDSDAGDGNGEGAEVAWSEREAFAAGAADATAALSGGGTSAPGSGGGDVPASGGAAFTDRAKPRSAVPSQGRGSQGGAAAVGEPGARTEEVDLDDADRAPGDEGDDSGPSVPEDADGQLQVLDDAELRAALEAILLVVDEPVAEMQLAQITEQPTERVSAMLEDISARYTAAGHGFDLRRVAGGWRLYTRPEYAAYVERFVLDGQSVRLTQAALETLAVVAYKQPVTRSRISAIRGVNCDGVMRTLVTRGLIEECGTEGETGAYLYRTTPLFLEKLGLNSVDQLPPLAPFLPDDVEEVLDAPG